MHMRVWQGYVERVTVRRDGDRVDEGRRAKGRRAKRANWLKEGQIGQGKEACSE